MRITTGIIMFYIWLTAAANLVESSGIAASLGHTAQVTAGDKLQQAVNSLSNITSTGLSIESLTGAFVALTSSVEAFGLALSAGPRILLGLGIPPLLVAFIHAPVGLLAARLGAYALTGREI
jgi:hypothetical protein